MTATSLQPVLTRARDLPGVYDLATVLRIVWEVNSYRAIEWYDEDEGTLNISFHRRVLDHRTEDGSPVHRWVLVDFHDAYHHRAIAEVLTRALHLRKGEMVVAEWEQLIPVIDPWAVPTAEGTAAQARVEEPTEPSPSEANSLSPSQAKTQEAD